MEEEVSEEELVILETDQKQTKNNRILEKKSLREFIDDAVVDLSVTGRAK